MSCNLKNESCGFRCTGYEGKEVWKELHTLSEKIDCEECSHHADALFTGLHDHVNAGLGKNIHNLKNYKEFVNEIKCAYDNCIKTGRCK